VTESRLASGTFPAFSTVPTRWRQTWPSICSRFPTPRREAAEQAAKSVGGKIESFYFAFGDADAFVIADVPDHASASAVSLAVGASGGARCKTTVLITPEEVDHASKKPLTYTGPGR